LFPHVDQFASIPTALPGSGFSGLAAPQAVSSAGKGSKFVNAAGTIGEERTAGLANRACEIKLHKLSKNFSLLVTGLFQDDAEPVQGFNAGHLGQKCTTNTRLIATASSLGQVAVYCL
jgi:hypothetical protein